MYKRQSIVFSKYSHPSVPTITWSSDDVPNRLAFATPVSYTHLDVYKRQLLGVLSLGIVGGTNIRIIADGADEESAVDGLVTLVESGFAE